ncbi:hypothetical protein HNR62_002932 [Oceanisphaera litoralis]|uniref:hypothetical protein n=1 Tax=Oceanisphaera litoralis TaxID=225144 RepID=UPI00195D55AB|nr:hypothetical protein [Oceanisphaera litoralis]MBM7457030.1 hypothetical protein [Oceanisphaera litoralis]
MNLPPHFQSATPAAYNAKALSEFNVIYCRRNNLKQQERERPDRSQDPSGSVSKVKNLLFHTAYFRIQELGAHYQQRMRVYSKPGLKTLII